MAVLGRLLVSSAERLDLPDLLSLDSYAAGDWKYFLQGLVGSSKPYILKGFDVIDPQNAIGTQSCSIRVADSVVFYPGSNAGSFYHGLPEGNANSTPLVPELRKNTVNFVYLTFSTFNTSVDTRAFWDPDKDGGAGGEFTQDVNTESVLKVDINVSTGSFPANTVPVAKITVGPVVITKIEDARDLMFRLGSGGISPNPYSQYTFRSLPTSSYQRIETPTSMTSPSDPNPFQGADKNLYSLKEWMDVVMTKLLELGGTTFWYEDTSTVSLVGIFNDALATAFKSKGQWQHSSATPGLLTWTEDVHIKETNGTEDIIVRAGNKTLTDEQVAYIPLIRNQPINAFDQPVSWTNGQAYVNTIGGSVGLFANLSKGDWIKKTADGRHLFVRVEEFYDAINLGGSVTTPANARSIRLNTAYQGSTAEDRARYNKGVYLASDVVVANRNSSALTSLGGNFHWMALRSDTIENIGTIESFSISGTLSEADGETAKVAVTSHGLQDGDRITVTAPAAQAGTYEVEVEDADTFYIQTTDTTTGAFTAFYGLATTVARDNGYGLQLESANHNFNSGDSVIVAGTTNFNGSYTINKRSSTQFQFAIGASYAQETVGTATLARVIVRYESGATTIIQGEVVDITGPDAQNIRNFIGMTSHSQSNPLYMVPTSYNALHGMANYNSLTTDNLTTRVSKLTAMMADKAQDKTVQLLTDGLSNITNTTNGAAQEITFTPSGATLIVTTPGSTGQATVSLPDSAPGISLNANQVAYITIDRNATSTPAIQVSDIISAPIDENTFVVAARLASTRVWLWDGTQIGVGTTPSPVFLNTIVRQDRMLKLVEGGTWSWDLGTQTLTWDATAYLQVPGLANSVNEISAGSVVLAPGEVAYIDINRVAPGGVIVPAVTANSSLTLNNDRIIIARREGNDVVVGNHSMRLIDGESKSLYAGVSNQLLQFVGATSNADSNPSYSSTATGSLALPNYNSTDGESLGTRAAKLTAMLADVRQDLNIVFDPGTIVWDGGNINMSTAQLSVPGTTVGAAPISINALVSAIPSNWCAYIDVNRTSGAGLTATVASIESLTPSQQRLIILRNIGGMLLTR